MATDFYISDYNVDTLGLLVGDVQGWAPSQSAEYPTVPLADRAGMLVAGRSPSLSPRQVQVVGELKAASLSALLTAQDELARRAMHGLVELSFGDDATKFIPARCTGLSVGGVFPHFVSLSRVVTLGFTGFDPYRYSKTATVISAGSSPVTVPLGTAPVSPMLFIYGSATNPTITLRDPAGNVLQTMAFTITLASTDYLVIDALRQTITRYNSGVSAGSQLNTLSLVAPSGDFIRLDPAYAGLGSLSLEVSSGVLEVRYRRAWF